MRPEGQPPPDRRAGREGGSSAARVESADDVDAVERDDQQRVIDAEVVASAAGMSAPLSVTDPDRSARDSEMAAARQEAGDLREKDLHRRERQSTSREADTGERRRLLDDREREVSTRERSADQREIDAEVTGGDEHGWRGPSEALDTAAVMTGLGILVRSFQDLDDVQATAQAIVAAAVDAVHRAAYAGLLLVERRQVTATVATDRVVSRIHQAQHDTGEGPAMTSLHQGRTVRVDDLAADPRWPRFTARAANLGVRSILAVHVSARRRDLGVLTLYSPDLHAFDDDTARIAELFAAHAAVATAAAQNVQHLTAALKNRDAIGQAKGILMERHRLSADEAFVVLRRASQRSNAKLADVALVLIETGVLPGAAPGTLAATDEIIGVNGEP